jgi:hypothetical protein
MGHMFYPGGLEVQKAKVGAISHVLQLINVSWLQTFLGLCNYCQRFINGFNIITKPLIR